MTPLETLRQRSDEGGLRARVHLNNAGIAPLLPAGRAAAVAVLEQMMEGTLAVNEVFAVHDRARASVARLLGAPRDDVAFFSSCSAALSQVAFGMSLQAGDELVVPSREDWSLDLERMIGAITAKTRVVAVSWIEFSTGASADLRALADAAHRVGAWLVVDAIQGLGVIPFDLPR